MRRAVLMLGLLTSVLPVPALAENGADVTMLQAGDARAGALDGVATGATRMIYLDSPPAAGLTAPAPPARTTGRPPRRPLMVIANSCDWPDAAAALPALRASLAGPVWLLTPTAGADCAADEIATTARKAAEAEERDRLALALDNGLRLSDLDPGPAKAATLPATGAAPAGQSSGGLNSGGKLVISALPAGTVLSSSPATVIRASAIPAATGGATPASVAATSRAARAIPATLPRRAGQPEPAVIVGELASLLGADTRGEMGVPREIRDRIRRIDAAFFDMLLRDGRFDPRGEQYAAAIQTELQQMGCYSGAVDGDWGAGSLAAVQRYFSTLGQAQAATVPGPALYRQIAGNDSLRCPAPRVVTPRAEPTRTRASTTPARNTGGGTATRSTTPVRQSTTQARPAQAQPTAPPAAATANRPRSPQIDPSRINGLGSGVIK